MLNDTTNEAGVAPTLTEDEADNLALCERRVALGLESFRDAGLALQQIRDGMLYRATHATFEDYCRERWHWSRQRAHQIIECAEIASELSAECQPLVDNERQARALAAVPAESREAVLKEAAASGKVTAKAIKEAAAKRQEPNEDPPRVQCGVPEDAKARAHKITRKVIALADDLAGYLASLNPTADEMEQAAAMLRDCASRLEANAKKLKA